MGNYNIIQNLKDYVGNIYLKTNDKIKTNIFRGHSRSISSDIEDGIAIFIYGIAY